MKASYRHVTWNKGPATDKGKPDFETRAFGGWRTGEGESGNWQVIVLAAS